MTTSDSTPKKTTLSIKIKNKAALYGSYMPFVNGKGVFIPTQQKFSLGDVVHLHIELLEVQPEYEVTTKVVWVTPMAAQGNRTTGIGVQFVSDNAKVLVDKIERELIDMLNTDQHTYTM